MKIKLHVRKKIVDALLRVLAESYVLYLKTHNFRWNVTEPMYQPLHSVLGGQYGDLAEAVDEIAERIRALGFLAPVSISELQGISSIEEVSGEPKSIEMIKELLDGHETIFQAAKKVAAIAQQNGDEETANLMMQRIQAHDKAVWMLRSFLNK